MLFNSYAFVVLVAITMIFYYAPNVAFRGGGKIGNLIKSL